VRVLIVGGDGVIGAALADHFLALSAEVYGTTRRLSDGHDLLRVNLRYYQKIFWDLTIIDKDFSFLPDVDLVYICAAMARFADCRENPDLAWRVNVEAPALLAKHYANKNARVVFLSTCAVLGCDQPGHGIDSPVQPGSLYGIFKAEAEKLILETGAGASVVRLTKVLLPNMPLLLGWITALARCETIEAFSDMRIAPLHLSSTIQGLAALQDHEGGVYHISGSKDISYAHAAQYLASFPGHNCGDVREITAASKGIPEGDIMRWTALDVSRLTKLCGWEAPDPLMVIDKVFKSAITAVQT